MLPVIIGSLGVGLLLLAFVLNLLKKVHESHPVYLIMNVTGAGLAAWYAWAGGVYPFVILESVWGAAALVRLISHSRAEPPGGSAM